MMRARLLLAALLLAAGPCDAKVRALFVGINDYRGYPDNPIAPKPLHGAVNDVAIIKAALAQHYQVDVGPMPAAGDCQAPGSAAITLIDQCATRDAILRALDAQIDAAASGDLIIFYFSGHGAYRDDYGFRAGQDAGNSTLVPFDGRIGVPRDIYDVEVRDRLYRANRRGISVLTIFDSCSSGTANRDLRESVASRNAPPISTGPPPSAGTELPLPEDQAYLVHLAAVADNGLALEYRFATDDGLAPVPQIDGVFTRALALALAQDPGRSTYRDIAERTRWLMAQLGVAAPPVLDSRPPGARQQPMRLAETDKAESQRRRERLARQATQAEGDLDKYFLGNAAPTARIYPAVASTGLSLDTPQDGRLSGLTTGSRFSVHCSLADAGANREPVVGEAVVTTVSGTSAKLQLAAPLAACADGPVPNPGLGLRETRHSYLGLKLRIGARGADAAEAARLDTALAGAGALLRDDANAAYYLSVETDANRCNPQSSPRTAAFRAADGRLILCLGNSGEPTFDRRLADIVRAAANFHAVALLPTERTGTLASITLQTPDCDESDTNCHYATGGNNPVLTGDGIAIDVTAGTQPVYAYALLLDGRNFRVQPLNGAQNNDGTAIPPEDGRRLFAGNFGAPGELNLLVLVSPKPISLAALYQQPVRDAGGPPPGALERLLIAAGQGRRGEPEVAPELWDAKLTRFTITAKP